MVKEVIKADLLTLVGQLQICIKAMDSGNEAQQKLASHNSKELIKKLNLDG